MTARLRRRMGFGLLLAAGCAIGAVAPVAVSATEQSVRIGFITTLSTPAGYIGEDIRDGFRLAIDQGGGKLDGVPDARSSARSRPLADLLDQSHIV